MHLVAIRPASPEDAGEVLDLLAQQEGLEVAFGAREFHVAVADGKVVACGRLRRHADGALEVASVATAATHRRQGIASKLLATILARVREPVYALALAPRFFEAHGFQEVARAQLPPGVAAKASGMCASRPFKALVRP